MGMHVPEPGGGDASAGGVRTRTLAAGGCAVEVDLQTRELPVQALASDMLASSTGMPAPQIAAVVRTDESHVRKVIHAFNDRGFASLDPEYRGGRPKKTTPAQRDRIVAVARTRPDHQGVALTRWSLPKLQAHLAGMGIVLSEEALPNADRRWALAPAHPLVEVEPGPRLHRDGRADAGAVPRKAPGRRGGEL